MVRNPRALEAKLGVAYSISTWTSKGAQNEGPISQDGEYWQYGVHYFGRCRAPHLPSPAMASSPSAYAFGSAGALADDATPGKRWDDERKGVVFQMAVSINWWSIAWESL